MLVVPSGERFVIVRRRIFSPTRGAGHNNPKDAAVKPNAEEQQPQRVTSDVGGTPHCEVPGQHG